MKTTTQKERWIKRPVNMRRLRMTLFGEDRIPLVPIVKRLGTHPLFTSGTIESSTYLGSFEIVIAPQGEPPGVYPVNGKPRHRSKHRLFAYCEACGRNIPVGRMQQHKH